MNCIIGCLTGLHILYVCNRLKQADIHVTQKEVRNHKRRILLFLRPVGIDKVVDERISRSAVISMKANIIRLQRNNAGLCEDQGSCLLFRTVGDEPGTRTEHFGVCTNRFCH